jgi:general secretion pathway protein A
MYESYFGIDGPPFQLSLDPSFYFDSHGHHRALAALRRGLSEPSGFTVISGEIGAGKTTVVRAILAELKPEFFSVAQVVSSQLDADELLGAVSIGFGITARAAQPSAQAANLRSFLADLGKQWRRAVLIIDEAQNLHRDAFDQLVGFATRRAPRGRGMNVCLVGQPELQAMLDTAELSALREQVVVSCHLGPLDRDEILAYIEHRLCKVGWSGSPSFEARAFDEIYRWTDGIPRRINRLCNRLLMSRFLAGETTIDAATVAKTARDLRAEIGEPGAEPLPLPPATGLAPIASRRRPRRALTRFSAPVEASPLLCVAASLGDHLRAAALMSAMATHLEPTATKLVRVHDNDALALSGPLFARLDTDRDVISLGVGEDLHEAASMELKSKFERIVDRVLPKAVVVFGASEAALACSAVARARGVWVVCIGADPRFGAASKALRKVSTPAPDLADLTYTTDVRASHMLARKGVPAERVHCVGNLLVDAVQIALRSLRDPRCGGQWHRVVIPALGQRGRYALLLIDDATAIGDRQCASKLLNFLRGISRDIALVWPIRSHVELEFKKHRLDAAIFFGDRICRLPAQPFANHVELLRNAACVLSDSGDALEEAGALRVPCLKIGLESSITAPVDSHPPAGGNPASATRAVWTCGFVGGVRDDVSELPDGRAGARIAGHLCLWLAAAGRIRTHRVTEKMPTNTDNAGPTPLLRDRHRGFPE